MQRKTLEKFIDLVKVADQSNKSEIRLNINDARNLSSSLGKLLLKYTEALEGRLKALEHTHNEAVESSQVELDGGTFN